MKSPFRFHFGLCSLCFMALIGCRTAPPGEAIPQNPGLSDEQVLAVLAQRAGQVQRVMASGTLRLESESEGSVRLDVALLASGDDRLRLRAWKLGQPVFDLTRDGDSVWLWASSRVSPDASPAASYPVTAGHLDAGWRLIAGRLFAQAPDRTISSEPFIVQYDLKNSADATGEAVRTRLVIDRDTQTLTHSAILDPSGNIRQRFSLQQYRLIDGIPWATVVASGNETNRFHLTLDEVELNGELPASAFQPPRNAQRQP